MEPRNFMEEMVTEKLDEIIDTLGCCKCSRCRSDITAYALNRLSPKYVNSENGWIFAKAGTVGSQFEIDLLTALYEAAEQVKKHPRH